ncbi:MAG: hypothetical protein JWN00_1674 [Actinomycetia bacterium]|jgi:anthranilate phosphoribosyltransferase|nr:hypothetical protein [Actinomycetes bacterium]
MKIKMLLLVPLVAGLAACGAGGKPAAQKSFDPQDAALKFAQCMRQNGVNMKDPQAGRIDIQAGPGDKSKVDAAMKKCQPIMAAGGKLGTKPDQQHLDQMLKFAQCMRQHGVNMKDPSPGGGVQMVGGPGDKAKMDKAIAACKQYAPGDFAAPSGPGGK